MALTGVSKSIMSWTLLPIDGMGLHLCLKLVWGQYKVQGDVLTSWEVYDLF